MRPVGGDTITLMVETLGAPDKLGVRPKTYTNTDVPGCSVQRMEEGETVSDIDALSTMRTVFAPPSSTVLAIKSDDKIAWMGNTYHVNGDIDPQTNLRGIIDHVQFVMKRTASTT